MTPFSLCPFALLLGQPCPGCGMGRALWACLQGDFAAACRFHPLGPVAFAAAATLAPLRAVASVSPRCQKVLTTFAAIARQICAWPLAFTVTLGIWLARFGGAFGGPADVRSPFTALFLGIFG